jgi:hypothetical protein
MITGLPKKFISTLILVYSPRLELKRFTICPYVFIFREDSMP